MVGEDFETRVVGAVGLFPTVVDIARSESGMKASVSTFSLIQSGPLENEKYRRHKSLLFCLRFERFLGRIPCDGLETAGRAQLPHFIRPMREEVLSDKR